MILGITHTLPWLILLAGCLAGLALACWVKFGSRRPAAWRFGAQMTLIGLILVLMAYQTSEWLRASEPHHLPHAIRLGLLGLLIALLAGGLRRLRAAAQLEVDQLPRRRPTPSFLWQAVLISCPVALFLALGLWVVRRDYVLADEEAARRARDLAEELSQNFGQRLAAQLSQEELTGSVWEGDGIIGGEVAWPGRSDLGEDDRARYRQELGRWQQSNPGISLAECLPVTARVRSDGVLYSPVDYPDPPRPPDWAVTLTGEERRGWDQARQAEVSGAGAEPVRAAYAQLMRVTSAPEVAANVAWGQLLLELPELPAIDRVARLTDFAGRYDRVAAESGLPLPALALARAVTEAERLTARPSAETNRRGVDDSPFLELAVGQEGRLAPLFELLRLNLSSAPSVLSAPLLAVVEALAAEEPAPVQQALGELRQRWQSQERRRALVRQLGRIVSFVGTATTNVWFDHEGHRWLAITHPSELHRHTSTNGLPVVYTNLTTVLRFFRQDSLERMASRIMNESHPTMPSYLGLRIDFEGETILDTTGDEDRASEPPPQLAAVITDVAKDSGANLRPQDASRRLAEATGVLSLEGRMLIEHRPGAAPKLGSTFETMPSRPRFAATVHLASPRRLYAAARQRALLFGGLLMAAAATSVLGLAFAWRAFQRQTRLVQTKANFVSSVSHELRAPIASMRLLVESLECGRVADPVKQAEYYRLIGQECRRLGGLVENVLDFSRLEQGRGRYEFEPTDLLALVRHTVDVLRPYADGQQITLQLDEPAWAGSEPFPQPCVDGRAIQQALVNLLDNAIKHSPSGGLVTITLALAKNPDTGPVSSPRNAGSAWIELSVTDQGPGIPVEDQARIFEPFYRRGSELRRETAGIGIGLALVKHSVEAHGGTVRVDSRPGQGSRFTIALRA
jgi:two-component system phosphate regulon sensor histidine kinase PhoR